MHAGSADINVGTMEEFHVACRDLGRNDRWIFRGQADASWHLLTTFERASQRFEKTAEQRQAGDQTPALQLAALKSAGCKTIFKDAGSHA